MTAITTRASALPSVEKARVLLAQTRSGHEVKKIRAVAQAVATMERGREIGQDASEIVGLANRRIGELRLEVEDARSETPGPGRGKKGKKGKKKVFTQGKNVSCKDAFDEEAGIDHRTGAQCEKIAEMPAKDLDVYHAICRKAKEPPTRKGAEELARLDQGERDVVLKVLRSDAFDGDPDVRGAIRHIRREEAQRAISQPDPLSGKYRVIYADPPWKYGDSGYGDGPAEFHYPTMSIEELCDLPVKEIALKDSVLFMWVTSPLLEDSFKVIRAWGFEYKASFVWDKVKHNVGHYNSVRHEFLLICTRGSCTPDDRKLTDSVQSIERGEHSEKPEQFREIIQRMYPLGARIELFARREVKGWKRWGNQA